MRRTTLINARLYQQYDRQSRTWTIIENGALVMDAGLVAAVGPRDAVVRQEASLGEVIDVEGAAVLPGFIDCHTHVPFAAWRVDEYAARLKGVSYESLSRQKGGIVRSSRQWREASDADIVAFSEALCREAMRWGTTVMEMKSGYGLSVEAELRALRLIRAIREHLALDIVPTGLFLHALPEDLDRGRWLALVTQTLISQAVSERLIEAVDVFVEKTAFTAQEAETFFKAVPGHLLRRVHNNQFNRVGGLSLAVRPHARAVDHLEAIDPADIAELAGSDTAAVIMPGAAFYTNHQHYAPARSLIDAGVRVALATDLNPGTSPIGNLPTVMALAVNAMNLSPDEALAGVTEEAAYVLGREGQAGRLAPGLRAHAVVLDGGSIDLIPYRLGHNPVTRVVIGGETVHVPGGN